MPQKQELFHSFLPRFTIAMEDYAPQNELRWHRLLPQMIVSTSSLHVALTYLHKAVTCCANLSLQTKLWHQVIGATRKNVATYHIVVVIAHFIATIAFL
jgi:hypothetical protein